jgi:hypothetical protein
VPDRQQDAVREAAAIRDGLKPEARTEEFFKVGGSNTGQILVKYGPFLT